MFKIGLSTCGKIINEELFKEYHSNGITQMEISLISKGHDNFDYKTIGKLAKKYDIELWSYHLPFEPFSEFDISNLKLSKKTVLHFCELIKKASDIGIKKFIVHPSGEPINNDERQDKMKCAEDSLASLSKFAQKAGAVIAVENLPRTCLGNSSLEINELISVHDSLRVCFDTNHLFNENIVDFVRNVGNKIITTHVSDYDFVNERHWLPGEGKINWNELVGVLTEIGYDGTWLYEIDFKSPNTIIRNRSLNCSDFAKNAKEIFENKKITIFSKPKPNLGMWD